MSLRLSLTVLAFWLALSHAWAQARKQNVYGSLYAKAYRVGNAQPDSAIYYGKLALKATQETNEQAKAHWLIAFYAQSSGYYGFALQHYQRAYDLYTDLTKKAVMLKNMASCHYDAGNHSVATPIARQAVERFAHLKEVNYHIEALNLLANCYKAEMNFGNAQPTYAQAIALAKKHKKVKKLVSIYVDFANFQEKQNKYDSAIYYQRLALSLAKAPPSKESIRRVKLAWYFLQSKNLEAAEQSLQQAQATPHRSPKAWAYYWGLRGLVHYIKVQEKAATQAYQKFDSLLQVLGGSQAPPIQQQFAHKTAYDMYSSGYALVGRIWPKDEEKAYFARVRQWYALQKQAAHKLRQSSQGQVVLKDSLVIERAKPKIKVVNKVSLWWWMVLVATIAIGAIWVYRARRQVVQAKAQEVQARTDFVEAIKASPVKGFGEVSKAEVSMLAEAEHRLKRKLTLEEIKLLLMVVRNYKFSEIAVNLGIKESTARMRMQRLKERCGINHVDELLP